MPEIVSDGDIFQTPTEAANEVYSRRTNPGLGAFVASTVSDGPLAFLGRAAERGSQAGASVFDRLLYGVGQSEASQYGEMPPVEQTPTISPADANERFAPRDAQGNPVSIADKPISEGLAQIIGQQKTAAMQREGVLSRFAETHAWPTTFAAGAAASMLDPLNAASAFIPGVGEGALAARLGGGFAARTLARVGAGAVTGAAMQAPVSGLKMALAPEEATDYGIRDAMRDVLYGAAGMAALHTGLGTAGELLGRAGERAAAASGEATAPQEAVPAPAITGTEQATPAPPQRVAEPALPTLDAPTQNAAMRSAVGEAVEGRPVDVTPIVDWPAPVRPSPPLIGEAVPSIAAHRVATATGEAVDVQPVVVEANKLLSSADQGYDAALQPRQRARAAAEQQVREMALRLEPERLGFSSEADRGAPIVGDDGMVESGNGRLMAIRQAYAENGDAAQRYRSWLASQGVDVSRYEAPVLVRQRTTPLGPAERQAFAIAANRPATLALSAPERALADARAISPDMLELIRNPDDLGAVGNRDFVRSFVDKLPQTEQGTITTSEGGLSSEGLARVRNAVLARAYGGEERSAALLSRVSEATNDDVKSISNALASAAPLWAKLRADVEAGAVRPDVDLTHDLLEAVQRTADLRAKGTRLVDHLAQQDAFDQLRAPVESWMRMFYDAGGKRAASAVRVAEALKLYAIEARKVTASPGLDLGLAPVSAADLQRLAARGAGAGEQLSLGGRAGNGPNGAGDRGQVQRSGTIEGGPGAPGAGTGGARSGRALRGPAELAAEQRSLLSEGYAPGVSRDELAAANDAVFGKPTESPVPAEPAARPAEARPGEAAPAEPLPENLHPEDRAAIEQAAEDVNKAATLGEAFKSAGACLTGLI